jgi:DinB family protein
MNAFYVVRLQGGRQTWDYAPLMTIPPNPYAADLGNREALEALGDTPARIRQAVERWTAAQFERTYAPGKWSIRKVLIHLAQTELALGTRVRFALAQPAYTAQPFSQDDWLPFDDGVDAATALGAYTALRMMTLRLFRSLEADQLDREFAHPEYGALTVRWVAHQMAGHDIHHLKQIESVASTGGTQG